MTTSETQHQAALHNSWQITVGTLLGGPIAGGWLLNQNWNRVGEKSKASRAILVGVLLQLVIFAIIAFGVNSLPIYLIPLFAAGAYHIVTESRLGPVIRSSREATKTKGLAAGYLLPVFAGLLLSIAAYGVYPVLNAEATPTNTIKIGTIGSELAFEKMTEEEAQEIGKVLSEANHFGDKFPTFAETRKQSGLYYVYIPAHQSYWDDPELVSHMNNVNEKLLASGIPFRLFLLDAGLHGRLEKSWPE